MNFTRWHLYLLLLVLALAAAAARFFSQSPPPATADLYDRLYYRCAGGHEITFTRRDVLEHYRLHYGQPLACPLCGSEELTLCRRDRQTGRFIPLPLRPDRPPDNLQ